MGVITIKKIKLITIGAIILPSISPNFIQAKFKGLSNLEFKMPKAKKISEITSDHNLIEDCPSIIGQMDINKKIIKNTIPKFLLVGSFIYKFSFYVYSYFIS
tara:strand:- start:41 stop:346 length:306 start_codon:yes stop_codon:yes gene_type:complete